MERGVDTMRSAAAGASAVGALDEKLKRLEELLAACGDVVVGFSGGVDSTFLAAVCARAIPARTMLMHLDSPFVGTPERASVAALSRRVGAAGDDAEGLRDRAAVEPRETVLGLPLVRVAFDPLADPAVRGNDPLRCYHCKRAGFAALVAEARRRGADAVFDGSNADDAAAPDRPGTRALRELGVRSPLMETGWHKDEERALLHTWGFAVWDMPAGACLATRIPTGTPITAEALSCVRACEDALAELGCANVRARLVDRTVCVEASDDDLPSLVDDEDGAADGSGDGGGGGRLKPGVARALRAVSGLAVDPHVRPYRRGSMNA